jgi:hypothetical protein
MAEACSRDNWDHTSNLMAIIANVFRAKGSRVRQPKDFNPFPPERRRRRSNVSVEQLTRDIMNVVEAKRKRT